MDFASLRRLSSLRLIGLISTCILAASCGGGGGGSGADGVGGTSPPPVTYAAQSGVAQKGPLIQGSTVTVQEVSANLSPTGRQFTYQVTSDLGTFAPTDAFGSQYVGVTATGHYFDELQNRVSDGPVTLNAYSDLAASGVLNVNLLTTLAYRRIRNLVTISGMTFASAQDQAETEVLTALKIPPADVPGFSTLNLLGGTDADHMLAAISSIFVYGHSAAPLNALIANIQSDLADDGAISAAISSTLADAAAAINAVTVAANLTQAFSSAGVTFTPENISHWIDQDGDGLIGRNQFGVPDASPSSVFTFPAYIVARAAGTSVSATAGQLSINGAPASAAVAVQADDVVTLSPGSGPFPSGAVTAYLMSGAERVARVSFVSGLVAIEVTPASHSLPKGLTQQFTATGAFSDGSAADLTNTVTWESNLPAIASVNAGSGLVSTMAIGSAIIKATSGSVSADATLTVTPAVVTSLSILPDPPFSGVGMTRQLVATGTYTDGTSQDVTNAVTWTSDAPAVATVGPTTGLTTGVALGAADISAQIGAATATASLRIVANSWSPTSNSLKQALGAHTATLLLSGKVLVTNGLRSSAELYDTVTGTWSPTGNVSTTTSANATLLPGGKVLLSCSTPQVYDPDTGTWSPTSNNPEHRSGDTATLLPNGRVLAIGGRITGGVSRPAVLYDPATNSWSSIAGPSNTRVHHTATLLANGKVLVVGGDVARPDDSSETQATAELYDPATGTWSFAGNLATPGLRYHHTATLLPDGRVLIAGGLGRVAPITGYITTAETAEIYDPVAGTWSITAGLSIPRTSHTATALPNGKILVVGGMVNEDPEASAELYDPVSGTWSAIGSLSTPRYQHAATLLPQGIVLVTGGRVALYPPSFTAAAELYW
ncbi:hypothetical protein GCM10011487_09210 [Steroidobacter agaridevorans]|uniref:BIG2 domain-containing protein n=1 Tax=Steroidobacter agaridevorans TaxID=2695856 RepID=A0A829Y7E0_9GAMM|nr:hypothetical protein GCM10011487_09210 [Steroidobacter agaridevorans]